MARISYDEVAGLKDAMPNDNYELIFGSLPGVSGDTRILTLRAQQCVIPGMSNEVMPVTLHSFDFIFSGKNTFPKTMTVGFVESAQDMEVMRMIEQWQQQVKGTKSGTSNGYSKDYTRDVRLNVYDGSGKLTRRTTITRCMPQDRPDVNLDSSGGTSPVLQTITFGYWKAISDDITER